jgi:membrane-bound ClpP family serine protease
MTIPLLAETLNAMLLPGLMVVVGLLLLFLEVYVPSGGLIGFISATLVILGVVLAFYNGGQIGEPWLGWVFLGVVLVLVPTILIVAFRTLPHTRLGRRLIPDGAPATEEARQGVDNLEHLVGETGEALTDLRPAGNASLADGRHDVTTDGTFIDQGRRIVVTRVEGNRIFVRPTDEGA